MKALLLKDIEKLAVEHIPDPSLSPRDVLLRVRAVGVCGTDMHLYRGDRNYNLDAEGHPIPLHVQPQILGHEFSGEIVEAGKEVDDLKPGDRVLCDQGLNCRSRGRDVLCPYCASGDSHQCEFYAEHGITGPPGALAEYIAMPAANCLVLPPGMPMDRAALVEPLSCVLHANELAERTSARYTFHGPERIKNVLILGAGPAGQLFLQYLRKVLQFAGLIIVTDVRERNLEIVRQFGGTPVNVARQDAAEAVKEFTRGELIQYVIEAAGDPGVFEQLPPLVRKQPTVLLYGHGYTGRDISVLSKLFFIEPCVIVPTGGSGGFDPDGRPTTYRRARELVSSSTIQVEPFITHRYQALEEIPKAFEHDFHQPDYIKGVLSLD